jgi:hypothetical protein
MRGLTIHAFQRLLSNKLLGGRAKMFCKRARADILAGLFARPCAQVSQNNYGCPAATRKPLCCSSVSRQPLNESRPQPPYFYILNLNLIVHSRSFLLFPATKLNLINK